MKEFIIIFIILVVIIGGAMYTNNYLNYSSEILLSQINNIKQKIIQDNQNVEYIKEDAQKLYNEWINIKRKWAFIVMHSELDLIETSFVKMKAQIEIGELDKSMEEIETSIFLVNHIKDNEKFCLRNIF